MTLFKKITNRNGIISISLSIFIHGIFVIILLLIEIKYPSVKKNKPIELDIKIVLPQPEKVKTIKTPAVKREIHHIQKTKQKEASKVKEEKETVVDTIIAEQKEKFSNSEKADSTEEDLKFAATLLDTFLVHHPEYAKFILQQQAKRLAENRKIVTRYDIERKINDELHEYIQKNFPEGSEHAMSPYGGPGMQIPIDGIIDAIRDVFK